ncbi:GH92 family glycosyl hydrolase [Phocaeicola vulgatus]|uniref:GH92 family glycosyl hydrolase n=1 Tax=Phocaeicola vulgatus TaxID=821 RepID=UPI00216650F5|nr:GH92 family glycosyl hydrolase [Phocaeicola vulgatus]MCS2859150.1 GH92 family glycosyl hydrolase [Phocaeicola vulgatus]
MKLKSMMKRLVNLLAAFILSVNCISAQNLTRWVNPFIGTGAVQSSLSGNNYPGATVPFGMVQLSPDTREAPDWAQASGYDYNDSIIYGFSHTRLSGTGASDFIDILLFPTISDKRKSTFTHQHEQARPGYYQVLLKDEKIQAELTASVHVGVHRYTCSDGDQLKLWLDLDHSANKGSWNRRIIQSQLRMVSPTVVEGYRIITGWAKLRKIYFHLEFSQPVLSNQLYDGNRMYENTPVINGTELRGLFCFDKKWNKELICKVALSPVSIENARLNMATEVPGWDFEYIARAAETSWEKELRKIIIQGTDLQKKIFYTALYHTMVQPNTMSDVNGEYMASDYVTRSVAKGEVHYSTFSLWDTFRAAHPLYTLMHTHRIPDFVKSMMRQYDYYGYLPVWQLWGQDNYCMIGNHSIPVIVDAVLKGVAGVDEEKAYEAVFNSSIVSHPNSPFEVWEKYGYMPENIQTQSVSITLEQAFDDWCVAQLAKRLGKEKDYNHFMKRSAFYRNLFNSKTGFFQPKNDKGEWIEPFDPYKYGANGGYPFTEGNAWQYFWYVPQNIPDLISLTGGNKAFVAKLDTFFTVSYQSGALNDNASGFVGQYAHGNEPSHHVAYLYACAGEPWKTQKYVAYIMNELYNDSSSGYAGNDDCGEMSAWYVFGALGFYPVNPVSGEYVIGTPMLEEAVIQLSGRKTFTVKAPRKEDNEVYICSMKLNGEKYTKNYITHQDIMKGGILEFVMTASPGK